MFDLILPRACPPPTKYSESSSAGNIVSPELHHIVCLQAQALAYLIATAGAYIDYLPSVSKKKQNLPRDLEISFSLLANQKYKGKEIASERIGGKVLASSPPLQTNHQKKKFKNYLEYYIAWLKGQYLMNAEVLDKVFIVLENAGFLYKLVTQKNNHSQVTYLLLAEGMEGPEGLTCLL